MSDLLSDLHFLAAGMRLSGSAFNDKLVDKAADRIAELEQRIDCAKVAATEMWQDSEKGDFELSELARLDLQHIINALWDDPDGEQWSTRAQQGVTDEQFTRFLDAFSDADTAELPLRECIERGLTALLQGGDK